MTRLHREERGGYMGKSWLLFVIIFIVLAVAVIDGGSILFARLQLQDLAEAAAVDAADAYDKGGTPQQALDVAQQTVSQRDPKAVIVVGKSDPKSFTADPSTHTITLTLSKDANTLFISKIGPLKKFAHMEATAQGSPPTL